MTGASAMALGSAGLVVGALTLCYRIGRRWPFDVVGLFCAGVGLLYVSRAVLLAVGLDEPFPGHAFSGRPDAMVEANLWLATWLFAVAAGLAVTRRSGVLVGWVPVVRAAVAPRRCLGLAAAATGAAAAITLTLLVRHGGLAGLMRASKVDKELGGLFFLRAAPEIGALLALAAYLEIRRRGGSGRSIALAMAGINSALVFAWGSRHSLALVALTALVGAVVFRPPDRSRRALASRPAWVIRGSLALLVVVLVIFGARVARDITLTGELNPALAEGGTVRQLSVATNAVHYDAFVLAVRDTPTRWPHRGSQDFVSGASGMVPRAVWAGKPENVAPGAWFRQRYEPNTRNGWPMGAAGEWYLAFGGRGIVVGGLVSGLLLGLAAQALRNSSRNTLAFAISVIVALQLLLTGFHVQTPLRWMAWCLPLLVCVPLVTGRARARTLPAVTPLEGSASADRRSPHDVRPEGQRS